MDQKDAFDLWWEWAEKPLDSPLAISAEIHEAVMALPLDVLAQYSNRGKHAAPWC